MAPREALRFHKPGREATRLPAGSLQCRRRHAHAVPNRRHGGVKGAHKKKDMLSELAFSGRHAKQSLWVLVQKYNAAGKNLREQTKWVALFHRKDRHSFADALDENDVVPRELHTSLRTRLAECKHAKLVLKTDPPTAYVIC